MGDRANVVLLDNNDGNVMFVYTHWSGDEWPAKLQEALKFGKSRWGDPQYLARIIVSQMFRDLVNKEAGGGLSTEIGDNGHPLLCVDLLNDNVGWCHESHAPGDRSCWHDVMSFEEFVALKDVTWESLSSS